MRTSLSLSLLLLLATGCPPAESTDKPDTASDVVDVDGDGFTGDDDCNDEDGTVYAGAAELCDGVDNDCNGDTDDNAADAATFYLDADADGFGDDVVTTAACSLPAGYADAGGDCNDADPAYNPGVVESDCADSNDYNCDGSVAYEDADGDTVPACLDCNDSDAAVNPAAIEVCNDIDDDCDTEIDEDATDAPTWYEDADADGFGTDVTQIICDQPAGFAMYGGDCNDGDAAYNPGVVESDCTDPNDYNCDDSVGYADADGDNFAACEDCNDADATYFPGAVEYCDGGDNNCDSQIDEGTAADALSWYADVDVDGYGDINGLMPACSMPVGYVADNTDCDDASVTTFPGATEWCNGADDDCDLTTDEDDAADAGTWYADADVDGYGDAAASVVSCAAPDGYGADNTDCDDADGGTFPGAVEYCDGADDNCDTVIDEETAVDAVSWYADTDVDGYGDVANTWTSCYQPDGYLADNADCNDADAAVSPDALEICNTIDDNCDTVIDENTAIDALSWYADEDADSYGDAGISLVACQVPDGFVSDAADCDDSDAAEYPGAPEYCDGDDDNCDGEIDEDGAVNVATWYADADSDSYGDVAMADVDCDQPSGFVADYSDCNDADAAVNPSAAEICDDGNIDEDCDADADDADVSATGQATWYADVDADSFGDAGSPLAMCDIPPGYVADNTDCDDGAPAVNPAAAEVCDPADVDEDCNAVADNADDAALGTTRYYLDSDSDGYGLDSSYIETCDLPAGYQSNSTDCDDGSAAVNPGSVEVCDAADTDEDCSGDADDADAGATGLTAWYVDADGDDYGDDGSLTMACDPVGTQIALGDDCNDADAAINPSATEVCDSLDTDEDCSGNADDLDPGATGQTTWYADLDSDNFGRASISASACEQPAYGVADATDCDDNVAYINPLAPEMCDEFNVDEDCDTLADDADPSAIDKTAWYLDADGDDYGVSDTSVQACDLPTGYAEEAEDCDDANDDVSPGMSEVCNNGLDDDCNDSSDGCEPEGTGTALAAASAYWYGSTTGDGVGGSIAAVGDLDGDGRDDVGFGTYQWDISASADVGRAWVFSGETAAGATQLLATTIGITAATGVLQSGSKDYVGSALSTAGDFDSDGEIDIFVGAPNTRPAIQTPSIGAAGEAIVYSMPAGEVDRNAASASLIIQGTVSQQFVGYSLSGGLDATGDDIADVLVGAYGHDLAVGTNQGAAGLFNGGSSGTVSFTAADALFEGSAASNQAGQVVAMVPDMTGDGLAELVISAHNYSGSSSKSGRVYVAFGGAALGGDLNTVADIVLDGPNSTEAQFGRSASAAGDADGDGVADLWIGADGAVQTFGAATFNKAGAAYLFTDMAAMSATGSYLDAAVTLKGTSTSDFLGRATSGNGDFNGDGAPDVAVGSSANDLVAEGSGAVFLWYGPVAAGSYGVGTADYTITGMSSLDALGSPLAFMGDTNADGFDDLGVSAVNWDAGGAITSNVGAVFLILGGGY